MIAEKEIKHQMPVKSIKNIKKNPQSFLGISLVEKEVTTSHNLQDDAYEEWKNPVELEQNNPSQKNC